jgi:hypothetical protein
VACKICDWGKRVDFDRYFRTARPSYRVAAQWCQDRGLDISYGVVNTHVPHLLGTAKSSDNRELAADVIDKIAAEYKIELDPCAIETSISYQQQILSQAITIAGCQTLESLKSGGIDPKQVKAYTDLFGVWAKVISLEQRINPDAAMATIRGQLEDIKQIEAIIDV